MLKSVKLQTRLFPHNNFSTLSTFLFCPAFTLLSVLIVVDTASPEWSSSSTENLPLCTAQNEQHFPVLVPDGQGGVNRGVE